MCPWNKIGFRSCLYEVNPELRKEMKERMKKGIRPRVFCKCKEEDEISEEHLTKKNKGKPMSSNRF
jgi:hypothetical protein